MLNNIEAEHVYLACGATDLRKSIDGLAAIVQESFELNPFSNCLFAFCNRNKDKVKILEWDGDGFWLHYKRLEKGTFHWPLESEKMALNVNQKQLRWLLDGLTLEQKKAHKELKGRRVI